MKGVTIFAVPKPFLGHMDVIQRNAIRSWLNLDPAPDIILFGDDIGVPEAAEEFGVQNIPNIPRNRNGTPYIDVVFAIAQITAKTKMLCYINADNLLFQNFQTSIATFLEKRWEWWKVDEKGGWVVSLPRGYLIVGERWDVDITKPVDTKNPVVLEYVMNNHTRQLFPGLDYFVFPKGMISGMPAFVIGRAGWDNWLIYDARGRGIPVIDATGQIIIAHQNHGYNHVPQRVGETWKGSIESNENLMLVKNRYIYLWELADSNCVLTETGVKKKPYTYRTFAQFVVLNTPVALHGIVEPIFRAGHIIKYGYLKGKEKLQ